MVVLIAMHRQHLPKHLVLTFAYLSPFFIFQAQTEGVVIKEAGPASCIFHIYSVLN